MEKGPIDWKDLHDKLHRGQVDLSQFLNELDKKYWTERNQYGDTFLHIACFYNQTQAVKMLLESKVISVDALNALGRTPIIDSICSNSLSTLDLLLMAGASKTILDKNGQGPYDFAKIAYHATPECRKRLGM